MYYLKISNNVAKFQINSIIIFEVIKFHAAGLVGPHPQPR